MVFKWNWISFTARRGAIAVYAVVVCLSIYPSQVDMPDDYTDRAGFRRGRFLWPIPNCVRAYKEIRALTQSNGTCVRNFAPNSGIRKFRHGKSMVWSTKLVYGRACEFSLTYGRSHGGWMHEVYYTLVDCNPLRPELRYLVFVVDLLFNLSLRYSKSTTSPQQIYNKYKSNADNNSTTSCTTNGTNKTPFLRFVLDLLCNLFLHCCAAVGKILTGTSRRAVPLR